MTWQTLVSEDPVMQLSLLFYVVLLLLALLPSRGSRYVCQSSSRTLVMDGEGICELETNGYDARDRSRRWSVGQARGSASPAFPELEASWFAQCTDWFRQAIDRIRMP
jgi:hypothetical protein